MENLSPYIHALLLKHDNLVIPKFGGFVARRVPARLTDGGKKLQPPFKQILFNVQLNLSDGLLEQYVAFKRGITNSEALTFITEEVNLGQKHIKSGDRLELEHIGYFFLDQEKKLCFEQDKSSNLLVESFGLGELVFHQEKVQEQPTLQVVEPESSFKKTQRKEEQKYIEPVISFDTQNIESPAQEFKKEKVVLVQEGLSTGRRNKSVWYKVAAAAVLAPFTFYLFWVPLNGDVLQTKRIAFSDFNPFHKHVVDQYKTKSLTPELEDSQESQEDLNNIIENLPEDALVYNFNYDQELVFTVDLEKDFSNDIAVVQALKNPIVSEVQDTQTAAFSKHLITGCFSDSKNAENHILDLKKQGFSAYLVDIKGGLHRVSAAGFHKNEDVSTISKKLGDQGISFWVLSK